MKIKLFRETNLERLENAVNEYLTPFQDTRVELHLTSEPGEPEHDTDLIRRSLDGQVTVMVVIKEEE